MSHYPTNGAPLISQRDFSPAQPQAQTSVPGSIMNVVAPVDNAGHVLSQRPAVQWIPQYHQPYGAQFTSPYAFYPPQQHYTTVTSTPQAATSHSVYGAIPGVGLVPLPVSVPITPPTQLVAIQPVPNAPSPVHVELPALPTATSLPNEAGSNNRERGKNTLLRLYDALEDPEMKDAIKWYEDDGKGLYGFQIPDTRPPKFDKVLRKHFSGTSDAGIKFSSFERNVKNQGFRRLSPKGATDVVWIHDSQEFYQGNRKNWERVRETTGASQHPQPAQNGSMSPVHFAIVEAITKEFKSSMLQVGEQIAQLTVQIAELKEANKKLVVEVTDLKSASNQLIKKMETLEITNDEANKTSADPLNPAQPQHVPDPSCGMASKPNRPDPDPVPLSLAQLDECAVVEGAPSGGGFWSHITFEAPSIPRTQMSNASPRRMASVATVGSRHPGPSRPPNIEPAPAVPALDPSCAILATQNPVSSTMTIQHSITPVYSTATHSNSSSSLDHRMSWRYDGGYST